MISEENSIPYQKSSPKKCPTLVQDKQCSIEMEASPRIFAKADIVGQPLTTTPVELAESQWMMDSKYGSVNLSLSTNPNCCGLFNSGKYDKV